MKLSPEPDWDAPHNPVGAKGAETTEEMLQIMLRSFKKQLGLVVVRDKNKRRLGSFTPEWFLSLSRKHQLRFITVAKRMHEGSHE